MKSRSRLLSLSALCLLSAGAVLFLGTATVGAIGDKPLAGFQRELLDLAFQTATALPVEPHIKNRSRAQEAVVATCLELDQSRRALEYAERIDNWRRGAAYADIAFYSAQHGDVSGARHCLDLARRISERVEDEAVEDASAQRWRTDRIRATIARTYLSLGQPEQAAQFEAGVAQSEAGEVEALKVARTDAEAFDEQLAALDSVVATGDFDQVRNALDSYAELYDRSYASEDRRAQVEAKIKAAWKKLPIMVHVELLMELSGYALDHEDRAKALALVEEAELLVNGSRWSPEDQLPVIARMAILRYRAGDEGKARSEADAALAMFDAARDRIVNIYRAGTLRPLAEAYRSMGDTAAALTVYKRAVEEGVENPNSRPRAEDLSATCCSMALHAVEPDAELWARLREVFEGLGQPW